MSRDTLKDELKGQLLNSLGNIGEKINKEDTTVSNLHDWEKSGFIDRNRDDAVQWPHDFQSNDQAPKCHTEGFLVT